MKKIIFALIIISSYIGVAEAQVFNPITTGNQYGYLQCVSHISSTVTGTTAETTLASCTIPGGAIGANGTLWINAMFSHTNGGNNKTLTISLGTFKTLFVNVTTTATTNYLGFIKNKNSQSAQIAPINSSLQNNTTTTSAFQFGSIDTSTQQTIAIKCQLASAGDSCSLDNFDVWIMRQN